MSCPAALFLFKRKKAGLISGWLTMFAKSRADYSVWSVFCQLVYGFQVNNAKTPLELQKVPLPIKPGCRAIVTTKPLTFLSRKAKMNKGRTHFRATIY